MVVMKSLPKTTILYQVIGERTPFQDRLSSTTMACFQTFHLICSRRKEIAHCAWCTVPRRNVNFTSCIWRKRRSRKSLKPKPVCRRSLKKTSKRTVNGARMPIPSIWPRCVESWRTSSNKELTSTSRTLWKRKRWYWKASLRRQSPNVPSLWAKVSPRSTPFRRRTWWTCRSPFPTSSETPLTMS